LVSPTNMDALKMVSGFHQAALGCQTLQQLPYSDCPQENCKASDLVPESPVSGAP
jgi:hypothetical protein